MGRKDRLQTYAEVSALQDADAIAWSDEGARRRRKNALGLSQLTFTATGHVAPAVTQALKERGWSLLPEGEDVRLADLRWVRCCRTCASRAPTPCARPADP